jgi:hypothetical protein
MQPKNQKGSLKHAADGRVKRIASPLTEQSSRQAKIGGCTVQDLVFLSERLPGVYQQVIANEISRRRLEWAGVIAHVTGHICGLAALSILATVAWHAIDSGASTQGASIICTGAASIVAVFVTGRIISWKHGRSPSKMYGDPDDYDKD